MNPLQALIDITRDRLMQARRNNDLPTMAELRQALSGLYEQRNQEARS